MPERRVRWQRIHYAKDSFIPDISCHYVPCSALPCQAERYNVFTFVVGPDVCTPITVCYAGKNYKIYDTYTITITGSTSTPSATDCNGSPLRYEARYENTSKGRDTYHSNTYAFYNKVNYGNNGSVSQSGKTSYADPRDNWGNDPRWGDIGRELGRKGARHASQECGHAYPGLHLFTGISKAYGEYARLRAAFNGVNVYAGIGKDWLFDGINKDKLLWHAGLGGYYSFGGEDPWGDILGSVTVAKTAAWENVSLMLDCDFTYWFGRWRRVGCYCGAGAGFADIKDFGKQNGHGTKFAWNLEFGLYKQHCCQKNRGSKTSGC